MYVWQWWSWCLLLTLQVTHGEELPFQDVEFKEEPRDTPSESRITLAQPTRQRRNIEWPNEETDVVNQLPTLTKRNPFLSGWGGQRLSDFLYYKRRPAFSSWGGKRGPAFSSWGGKRSVIPADIDNANQQTVNNITLPTSSHLLPLSNKNHPAYNSYSVLPITFLNGKTNEDIFPNIETSNKDYDDFFHLLNISDSKFYLPNYKQQTNQWNKNIGLDNVNNVHKNKQYLHPYDYNDHDSNDGTEIKATIDLENGRLILSNIFDKRAAPSFNSWGGKRTPLTNSWELKRAPAFNSWGGKRLQAFNSWGGKRAPSFNSWGGKRAPSFNSWGGKRAPSFNSWGGKRAPSFNSWGGKRAPSFNSWGGKRAFNSWGGKRASKYDITDFDIDDDNDNDDTQENILEEMSTTDRKKRSLPNNDENHNLPDNSRNEPHDKYYQNLDISEEKRVPAFNSWGGKRELAFNSWGGKRGPPAFNSWGGKRVPSFNSWGGKRVPSFNSWGGKRVPSFNSWGGKRDPSFNSWGGKRAPAFNSWGGKRAPSFNSWGGKREPKEYTQTEWSDNHTPLFDIWEEIQPHDRNFDIKRATLSNRGSGKRLPAFHSWGGKRSSNDYTHILTPNYLVTIPEEALDNDKDSLHTITLTRNPDINYDNDNSETRQNNLDSNNYALLLRNDDEANENLYQKPNLVKRNVDQENINPSFYSSDAKRNNLEITTHESELKEVPLDTIPVIENGIPTSEEENPVNTRKKRNAANDFDNSITLITADKGPVSGNGIRSSFEELDSNFPNDFTICCIKRAQYGDKNLFMQMLLKTKSFRDLSWPTIRPIRRGVDFYPWGGKRSSSL